MKKRKLQPALWLRQNKLSCLVLLAALVLFAAAYWMVQPEKEEAPSPSEYVEYDTGTILEILSDNTTQAPADDGGWRGEQLMLVEVTSGQYKGETLQVYNYVGPLYGGPLEAGDSAVLTISTYQDGTHTATVFEYNRIVPLTIVVVLFLIAAVAVGGKTGAKSLLGLFFTLAVLFLLLIPGLKKGFSTLPTVFLCCTYIAVVTLTILGGIQKKTICAMLGAISGTLLAMVFGLLAQWLCKIDGLRMTDVEPLLQLRQAGSAIGIRGLLVGGIMISTLGAVLDVTMGLASSLCEVSNANPSLSPKELFRSGMNIGRDMVGTMTNTLILAFLGSSFTLILYFSTLNLSFHQLISSAFFSIELISAVAGSIGVILSIPLTAIITAWAFGARKK